MDDIVEKLTSASITMMKPTVIDEEKRKIKGLTAALVEPHVSWKIYTLKLRRLTCRSVCRTA